MWESRKEKLPPNQFFVDLVQQLRTLFPKAKIDSELATKFRDLWIAEWRNGQSAAGAAKATCSCDDGKTITPSPGAGRDLGKRLARAPKGTKRGDFIAPEQLREVGALGKAKDTADKLRSRFDKVVGAIQSLIAAKKGKWRKEDTDKLEKLRAVAALIKETHDVAIAEYEKQLEIVRANPGTLTKGKPAALAPVTSETPSVAKDWMPAAEVWDSTKDGPFYVLVEASPDPQNPSDTTKVRSHSFPVGNLADAKRLFLAFVAENRLAKGNLTKKAGRVVLNGKPYAIISFDGKIHKVGVTWKPQGEINEYGEDLTKNWDDKVPKPKSPPLRPEEAQELLAEIQKGNAVVLSVSTAGLPTIHDFKGVEFKGFGLLKGKTKSGEFSFLGGNAMNPLGKQNSYSILSGDTAYVPFSDGSIGYDWERVRTALEGIVKGKYPKIKKGQKLGAIQDPAAAADLGVNPAAAADCESCADKSKTPRKAREPKAPKPKAPKAAPPAEPVEPPIPKSLFSDAEEEELANVFAVASKSDKG